MTDLRAIGFLALSPDGNTLAFTVLRLAGGADGGAITSTTLTVIPASGGETRELIQVKFPEFISSPVWSQDSRSVLFARASAADIMSLAESSVWQNPGSRRRAQKTGCGPWARERSVEPSSRRAPSCLHPRREKIRDLGDREPAAAGRRTAASPLSGAQESGARDARRAVAGSGGRARAQSADPSQRYPMPWTLVRNCGLTGSPDRRRVAFSSVELRPQNAIRQSPREQELRASSSAAQQLQRAAFDVLADSAHVPRRLDVKLLDLSGHPWSPIPRVRPRRCISPINSRMRSSKDRTAEHLPRRTGSVTLGGSSSRWARSAGADTCSSPGRGTTARSMSTCTGTGGCS